VELFDKKKTELENLVFRGPLNYNLLCLWSTKKYNKINFIIFLSAVFLQPMLHTSNTHKYEVELFPQFNGIVAVL
jgi:hypothetical protein